MPDERQGHPEKQPLPGSVSDQNAEEQPSGDEDQGATRRPAGEPDGGDNKGGGAGEESQATGSRDAAG
jgi:hypothetical protein